MKETEEKKIVKKQNASKSKSRLLDSIESKNIRHQRHDFKYRKIDMKQEELWEEWQGYHR